MKNARVSTEVVPPKKGDTILVFDGDDKKWVTQVVEKVTKAGTILTPDYEAGHPKRVRYSL